jgi:hypothetical protein
MLERKCNDEDLSCGFAFQRDSGEKCQIRTVTVWLPMVAGEREKAFYYF